MYQSFNNLTAYKQSKLIRTYNIKKLEMKFNFFMLGIHDRKILVNTINSFKKALGYLQDDERMIIYCTCMSRKLYHLNKFLYIKFSNRKAPRNETFLEEIADIHSINYNLKSIFSIKISH